MAKKSKIKSDKPGEIKNPLRRKLIIASIIIFLFFILLWIINRSLQRLKDQQPSVETGTSQKNIVYPKTGNDEIDRSKLLYKGMQKNNEVFELQRILKEQYGVGNLAVDGIFGSQTQTALQSVKGVNSITLNSMLSTFNNAGQQLANAGIDISPWKSKSKDYYDSMSQLFATSVVSVAPPLQYFKWFL